MLTDVLPQRAGDRPQTGDAVPHVQLTQTSPPELRARLEDWMGQNLPGTVVGPSEVSDVGKMRALMATAFPNAPITHDVETAFAVFLDGQRPPAGVVLLPPSLNTEFAHVHPDGSLHVALAPEDRDALVAAGWGERHPLYSEQLPVMMLYAPRTPDELEVAQAVIAAAYRYATGLDQVPTAR